MYEPYKKTAKVVTEYNPRRGYSQDYSLHIRLNESQTTVIGELTLADLHTLRDALDEGIASIFEVEL